MPFYEKGDVRIHYDEVGSGFPLLVIPGGGLNSTVAGTPSRSSGTNTALSRRICATPRAANPRGPSRSIALTGRWEGWSSGAPLSSRRLLDRRCSGSDAPIVTPYRSPTHYHRRKCNAARQSSRENGFVHGSTAAGLSEARGTSALGTTTMAVRTRSRSPSMRCC